MEEESGQQSNGRGTGMFKPLNKKTKMTLPKNEETKKQKETATRREHQLDYIKKYF